MSLPLKIAIALAHFSVYVVVAISIWIFSQRSDFYRHQVKLRSLPSIYWGYVCFAIATSYEVAEHINDQWIYVSQISGLNNLFYSFIVFGLGFIALGLKKRSTARHLTSGLHGRYAAALRRQRQQKHHATFPAHHSCDLHL